MNAPIRHIGLFSATSIGIGAIVGGGILALAGAAFATTGPAALLAFALNGLIAIITALSFAELASAFPQSGGTYLFAKKVLSIRAAFNVGWVVWFASIVAAALYALGFSSFALGSVAAVWDSHSHLSQTPVFLIGFATVTVLFTTWLLSRSPGSGGSWVNILKVSVFAVLILAGFWVWGKDQPPVSDKLTPFFPFGFNGLIQAMGYTFIALQGFDLIAAVAGEIKEPRKILPRAMLISLFTALGIYLPLLLVMLVVGVPQNGDIIAIADKNPDLILAIGARVYLGPFGFWLVMISGVLSMYSALLANLFAASRIAQAMARDRTLPSVLDQLNERRGTPVNAMWVTSGLVILILIIVGDVSNAGAASSLIFLVSFSLTHFISLLVRQRQPDHSGFRTPGWPVLPVTGMLACLGLAVFQGLAVPAAGVITAIWLTAGFFFYLMLFGQRAKIFDAASEHGDPDLLELRGKSPLVLVPMANPDNAGTLSTLAAALSPAAGRVLLLNIAQRAAGPDQKASVDIMADILRRSMAAALDSGIRVECLGTLSSDPWLEIERVANLHHCALTLMGMSDLSDKETRHRLETLAARLPSNLAILRARDGWDPLSIQNILVPIGGRDVHNALRARLLTALYHQAKNKIQITYLIVAPADTKPEDQSRIVRTWQQLVSDESPAQSQIRIIPGHSISGIILEQARASDLLILGMGKLSRHRHGFSPVVTKIIADRSVSNVLVIGQHE